jgi:hypothetical protein
VRTSADVAQTRDRYDGTSDPGSAAGPVCAGPGPSRTSARLSGRIHGPEFARRVGCSAGWAVRSGRLGWFAAGDRGVLGAGDSAGHESRRRRVSARTGRGCRHVARLLFFRGQIGSRGGRGGNAVVVACGARATRAGDLAQSTEEALPVDFTAVKSRREPRRMSFSPGKTVLNRGRALDRLVQRDTITYLEGPALTRPGPYSAITPFSDLRGELRLGPAPRVAECLGLQTCRSGCRRRNVDACRTTLWSSPIHSCSGWS